MPNPVIKKIVTPQSEWQGLLSLREARTVLIRSADVTADGNGRKLVPAGSILGTATAGSGILATNAPAKVVNDATAEGILVNDVDVTYGDMEAAMAYVATANMRTMPVAPAAEAMEAMDRITFMTV